MELSSWPESPRVVVADTNAAVVPGTHQADAAEFFLGGQELVDIGAAVANIDDLGPLGRRAQSLDGVAPQPAFTAFSFATVLDTFALGHFGATMQNLVGESEGFAVAGINHQRVVAQVTAAMPLAHRAEIDRLKAGVVQGRCVVQDQERAGVGQHFLACPQPVWLEHAGMGYFGPIHQNVHRFVGGRLAHLVGQRATGMTKNPFRGSQQRSVAFLVAQVGGAKMFLGETLRRPRIAPWKLDHRAHDSLHAEGKVPATTPPSWRPSQGPRSRCKPPCKKEPARPPAMFAETHQISSKTRSPGLRGKMYKKPKSRRTVKNAGKLQALACDESSAYADDASQAKACGYETNRIKRKPHARETTIPKNDPRRDRAKRLSRGLAKLYPDAHCALHFENPLQLLVATILSAQCTDVRVNMVTPALFARYPDAAGLRRRRPGELETAIQSTGFFRNKARNIQACCKELVDKHGGQVPGTHGGAGAAAGHRPQDRERHPGQRLRRARHHRRHARHPAQPADGAHRRRKTPEKIERDLMELIPQKDWTMFSHRMIFHGRQVCHARKPKCDACTWRRIVRRSAWTK